MPGIPGWEAAADVDDIDRDRGVDDGVANAAHGFGVGGRGHRLAADMEADAEGVGGLAGGEQERLHVGGIGAELGGEAELRMFRADADADDQVEVGRGNAVARRRADDLVQLIHRVEAEGADAVLEIGFGDRFLGLDRVHEAERRRR